MIADRVEAAERMGALFQTAQRIIAGELTRDEVAAYFDAKAELLEFIASGAGGVARVAFSDDSEELAARARLNAALLRAGVEWPPAPESIGWDVL